MKNRYLYKAKTIHVLPGNEHLNGQWISGFLSGEDYITDEVGEHLIDSNTTCQCTGINDKNGAEIYEGDIFIMNDPQLKYTVEWHDTGFMGKQHGTYGSYVGLSHWREKIVVIGNVHDN